SQTKGRSGDLPPPSSRGRTLHRAGGAQKAAEGRTFHVTRRGACGGMPQSVAHRTQSSDCLVELVGLGSEPLPIKARTPVRPEHARNLLEREARGTSH